MSDDALVGRVCTTYRTQRALLGERVPHPLATIVRAPERPGVWDANFGSDVRARTPEEVDSVLAALDAAMPPGVAARKFFCDPFTPQPFVARLATEGFARQGTVQLVLQGELAARPKPCQIRLADREADWSVLSELIAENVRESFETQGRSAPVGDFLRQLKSYRREMGETLRFWIAREAGNCGFCASWEGVDGMGMIEWLFVRPGWRRRGVATALIARAVADVRERGARDVLIGASDGEDRVPRRLYASLGFRPVCITEEYTRFV